VYVESTELRPRIRVSADLITYGFGPQTAGAFENTRTYAEVLQDWRGWLREGILDTAILMDYKRDTLTTGGNDQRRMYAEWSDFAKDNQFRRSAVIGAGLYINDIASSARQARVALAPSPSGNSAIGWAGYSYRTPDDLTDTATRSGAAGRVELIKALTAPSQYDAGAPPAFAETRRRRGRSRRGCRVRARSRRRPRPPQRASRAPAPACHRPRRSRPAYPGSTRRGTASRGIRRSAQASARARSSPITTVGRAAGSRGS